MSSAAQPLPHRGHRRLWWGLLIAACVAAVCGIAVALDRTFLGGQTRFSWPPEPCVVKGVHARCGTFVVPENRAKPDGRTIGLHVVVLPAWFEHRGGGAVAFLAGGPGGAATEQAIADGWQSSPLNMSRDILLVDQRGTGGSKARGGDVTQYGTRMAMDDLDAVRAALGYRQLDVFGGSYGATAAQVYAKLHPASVRSLILSGASSIEVPFFGRYAANAQHALDQLAQLCASETPCRRAFPGWERRFGSLVTEWNAHPSDGTTGDELASVVHHMLLDLEKAVSIPLLVTRAATGDHGPLEHAGHGDLGVSLDRMGSSIWCNEPWTGLAAAGPWGTAFDSYTAAYIAEFRKECRSVPRRAEPRSLWTLPVSSRIPVLVLAGGADPQDPVGNLADLKRHFPDSRVVVLPHIGHQFGIGGCVNEMLAQFLERGTTKNLDTNGCAGEVVVPLFPLTG